MFSLVLMIALAGLPILFRIVGALRLTIPLLYAMIIPTLLHEWYYAHIKSILAFPTRTAKGQSKIKPILTPSAVVTVPRNYVDYIVTEYGIASLKGKTISERAKQLIAISHPDDRAELTRQAQMLNYI